MKLLSIAVPSYNSQDYLHRCLDSLLPAGERVEILIINDGSTDDTAAIADEYQRLYPGSVRVIHQENGGHGAAVMTGLRNATSEYFKVVDSDDWVDEKALAAVLTTLESLRGGASPIDLLLCNYVYDKVGVKHKRVVRYGNVFPSGKPCTWDDAKRFHIAQYILMHSVIYRTQLLRDSGLELPRHTFYVDNLFVYLPMRYVDALFYLNVDLYHYFIGRGDQSVNEQVMIRRIDQQMNVNKLMLERNDLKTCGPLKLQKYMCHYVEIVTAVSTVLLLRDGSQESLAKKQRLWNDIREIDPWFYRYLTKKTLIGFALKHNGLFWRRVILLTYRICRGLIGFN